MKTVSSTIKAVSSTDGDCVSRWLNDIYPCTDCEFVGSLDAFTWGQCYNPCPQCGGKRFRSRRTGRFVYKKVPWRYFPILKRRVLIGVEWRHDN